MKMIGIINDISPTVIDGEINRIVHDMSNLRTVICNFLQIFCIQSI